MVIFGGGWLWVVGGWLLLVGGGLLVIGCWLGIGVEFRGLGDFFSVL